jgi:hypothetical protein
MRQPDGMRTPAASPDSSSGVAPSDSTVTPLRLNVAVPPSPVTIAGGRKRSTCSRSAMPRPVQWRLEAVEQLGRAAGPGLALGEVGDGGGEAVDVEAALEPAVALDEPDAALGGQRPQLAAEDDLGGDGRGVHDDDVLELVHGVAQHAHDGRDAAAGGDEQDLRRAGAREHELAHGLVELHDQAGGGLADEVVAHGAARDRLDGDGDAAVGVGDLRGQRVRAPLPDAVDVDADADVLAGTWGASRGRGG